MVNSNIVRQRIFEIFSMKITHHCKVVVICRIYSEQILRWFLRQCVRGMSEGRTRGRPKAICTPMQALRFVLDVYIVQYIEQRVAPVSLDFRIR